MRFFFLKKRPFLFYEIKIGTEFQLQRPKYQRKTKQESLQADIVFAYKCKSAQWHKQQAASFDFTAGQKEQQPPVKSP